MSLAFAPAPFPKPNPTKQDLKKLQGTWIKVRSVPPGNGEGEGVLVITDQRMSYSLAGTAMGEYTLTVDAKKKPKLFDFTGTDGIVAGNHYRGIYQLDGDILTFCYVMTTLERERPADFNAAGNGTVILSVYKRQRR